MLRIGDYAYFGYHGYQIKWLLTLACEPMGRAHHFKAILTSLGFSDKGATISTAHPIILLSNNGVRCIYTTKRFTSSLRTLHYRGH